MQTNSLKEHHLTEHPSQPRSQAPRLTRTWLFQPSMFAMSPTMWPELKTWTFIQMSHQWWVQAPPTSPINPGRQAKDIKMLCSEKSWRSSINKRNYLSASIRSSFLRSRRISLTQPLLTHTWWDTLLLSETINRWTITKLLLIKAMTRD